MEKVVVVTQSFTSLHNYQVTEQVALPLWYLYSVMLYGGWYPVGGRMMFLCMENMEMLPPLYAIYVARFELGESRIAINFYEFPIQSIEKSLFIIFQL